MPPLIATCVYFVGIAALFVLNRDSRARTSRALWIPLAWLFIASSRMVSQWLPSAPQTDTPDQYLDGSPLDRFVLTALLILAVIVLLHRGRQVHRLLRANLPVVFFFLYCTVSIAWSDFPDVALKRCMKAWGDIIMVMVVVTDAHPVTAIQRLLSRAGFLLIPLSILLIKYYPDLGRGYVRWTWTPVYTGVTTNKNYLGMICLIFGLASLWVFLAQLRTTDRSKRHRPLLAHGVILCMVLWLFWIANSMTSFSCFVLAGSLMVLTTVTGWARQPAVIHLLVLTALSIAASALFLGMGTSLVETLGRDPTLTGRTELWRHILDLKANPWLGAGFESFWLGSRLQTLWAIYWWHPNEAHNGYLEVFLNLGWVGIGLLTSVLVTGYSRIVGAVRRNTEMANLWLAYFVVVAAYNFTEAGFRMLSPVWIVFLLARTVVPAAPVVEQSRAEAALQNGEEDPESNSLTQLGASVCKEAA